ncbi:MAG: hypothetical protein WA987_02605 [Cellvibrio sp.]
MYNINLLSFDPRFPLDSLNTSLHQISTYATHIPLKFLVPHLTMPPLRQHLNYIALIAGNIRYRGTHKIISSCWHVYLHFKRTPIDNTWRAG